MRRYAAIAAAPRIVAHVHFGSGGATLFAFLNARAFLFERSKAPKAVTRQTASHAMVSRRVARTFSVLGSLTNKPLPPARVCVYVLVCVTCPVERRDL